MPQIIENYPDTIHAVYGVQTFIESFRGIEGHWQEMDITEFCDTRKENPDAKVTVEVDYVVGGYQLVTTLWLD